MTEIPKKGENKYNVPKVPLKVSWNVLFHPQDKATFDKKRIDSGESCDYSACSHLINFMRCINHHSLTFIEEPMV